MQADQANVRESLYFHSKRGHAESKSFELYRCIDEQQRIRFSAHAIRFGKPVPIFDAEGNTIVGEIRNRKNYLLNGRTDFHDLRSQVLLGSYSRLSRIYDAADQKIGRWRDARSWSEDFKINLVDAIGNALLGAGDVPGGANPSDTHLLTDGKEILATLQREKLPFFPDPPKRSSPGKLAKFASKIVPGELGKSLGEITPPYGWRFTCHQVKAPAPDKTLLQYAALCRIEFLRWSRSS